MVIVYLLLRVRRNRDYARGLAERFGTLRYGQTDSAGFGFPVLPGGIWVHAVSVGEVITCVALLKALRERHPERPLYVSVSTLAGRAMADERLRDLADHIFYAPIDFAWIVRRVLRRLRPASVIVLETEIWPNLWREAVRFGATLYVVNGRISDQTIARYRSLRWFFAPVLALPTAIFAQSEQDRVRYAELGAKNTFTAGNLKYDFRPPASAPADIAGWAMSHQLFIAASTMPPDEVDQVIRAFQSMPRGTRMLLAPRRPELFEQAAEKLAAAGVDFVRRTELNAGSTAPVLLLNTIGELASCFSLDAVVFIGGSIVTWGGHNILEPAFFGRSIVVGPHMQNFAEIDREFREAGAVRVVRDADELARAVTELLGMPGDLGSRARDLALSRRGVTDRIANQIEPGAPLTHRPLRQLFQGLSWLWRAGVAIDRAVTRRRRLPKPVISIGGIAMGGVGKTPAVLWLTGQLHARGLRVGILTRGYGRQSQQPLTLAPGAIAAVADTGDEAQLYLKAGVAHVGIGADRYRNGLALAEHIDVFVLDDGFQHWALHRDYDLVLIDPDDPNAGGGVFPAGLLREPHTALARASRVTSVRKKVEGTVPPGEYTAVCGIGNPASFWRTLCGLATSGVRVSRFLSRPDHHRFSEGELNGLPGLLLTTEKDAARLPPGAPSRQTVRISAELVDGKAVLEDLECLLKPLV